MRFILLFIFSITVFSKPLEHADAKKMVERFFALKYGYSAEFNDERKAYKALFYNDLVIERFQSEFLTFIKSYESIQAKITNYEVDLSSFEFEEVRESYVITKMKVQYKIETVFSEDGLEDFVNTESGRDNPYRATFIKSKDQWKLFNVEEIQPIDLSKAASTDSIELLKKVTEGLATEEDFAIFRKKKDEEYGYLEISNREDTSRSQKYTWQYSRQKAAIYALTWADQNNPYVHRFNNDCTNFVSLAVFDGGKKQRGIVEQKKWTRKWFYHNTIQDFVSWTWAAAHNNWEHTAAFTNGQLVACSDCQNSNWRGVKKGDIIYVAKGQSVPYHINHAMIVTHTKGQGKLAFYAQHSPDSKNRILQQRMKELEKSHKFWVYQVGSSYTTHQ